MSVEIPIEVLEDNVDHLFPNGGLLTPEQVRRFMAHAVPPFEERARATHRQRLSFFDHLTYTIYSELAQEQGVDYWPEVYNFYVERIDRIHWHDWLVYLRDLYGTENVNCFSGCTRGHALDLLYPEFNGGQTGSGHIGWVYVHRGRAGNS